MQFPNPTAHIDPFLQHSADLSILSF